MAVVVAAVIAAAIGGHARAGSSGAPAPAPAPDFAALGRTPVASIRDRVLRDDRTLSARRLRAGHGGPYTASTGEAVNVFLSDAYPVDESVNQRWAEFIARLVHGSEIAKVNVYVAPYAEVQSACRSTEADACYLLASQQLVVPGEAPPDGVPVEEIVAHEYGHHIALNRINSPWPAIAFGTKRWASYENVCRRVLDHTAFPGDEGANYVRNPGEAFAEAYRVLNDRKAPLSSVQLPWFLDASFAPDASALTLVEQDVRQPWLRATVATWRGRLAARHVRRQVVPTPRDGIAQFVLHAPAGSVLAVVDPSTNKVLAAARVRIRYGVCGERKLGLVVGLAKRGNFSVTISRP